MRMSRRTTLLVLSIPVHVSWFLVLELGLQLLGTVLEDNHASFCCVVPPHLELGLVARDLTGVLPDLDCIVEVIHDRGVLCSTYGPICCLCAVHMCLILPDWPPRRVKHGVT